MNNYHKLLLHLKQFEGDGKFHPVEQLFPNNSITDIKNILFELSEEKLIQFYGRKEQNPLFILEHNILTQKTIVTQSPLNDRILKSKQEPFKAKLTFKGSIFLKEELQMQESDKYKIAITGQGAVNTIVIQSQNVTIENKTNFANQVDKIIETIKKDEKIDIETKNRVINDLTHAKQQIDQNGKVSDDFLKRVLEYGSNISSIAQLVLDLFQVNS